MVPEIQTTKSNLSQGMFCLIEPLLLAVSWSWERVVTISGTTVRTRKWMQVVGREALSLQVCSDASGTGTVGWDSREILRVRVPELPILNRKHTSSETRRLSPPVFQGLPCLPGLLEYSTNKAHFVMTPMNSAGPKQQHSGWFLKCQFAQSALFLVDHPVFL